VEESLALGGVPVRLVDTAGIRLGQDAADEAERQGIVRSREALADADLVLLVRDATLAVSPDEAALMEQLTGRPHLVVENKCDLLAASGAKALASGLAQAPGLEVGFSPPSAATDRGALALDSGPTIRTSALTGEGIDALRTAMLRELGAAGSLAEGGLLNNLRQQEAVVATLATLDAAAAANRNALPHEIILLELHNALRALDSLTGETTTDDILERIFATFCIGK
jgi:tRNA modification GTPase